MGSLALYGLALALSGLLSSAQSTPPQIPSPSDLSKPSYSMTLTSAAETRLGGPLEVTLAVTNISNSELFWRVYRPYPGLMGFRFLLTKDGQEVETTFLHRVLTGRQRPEDPPEVWSGDSIILPKP